MSNFINLAIIDLGTNSIRLDVYQTSKDLPAKMLYREKHMVRLGEGVYDEGKFSKEAIKRTLKSFSYFKDITEELQVSAYRIIATSAMRASSNSKKFIEKVKEECDFDIEIISGKQEAKLILKGVLLDERVQKAVEEDKRFAFFDIGGGSTEVGILKGDDLKLGDSLELGAVRLKQLFFSNKYSDKKIKKAREYIREEIENKITSSKDFKKKYLPDVVFASSGTSKALQKLLDDDGDIKLKDLSKLNKKMLKDYSEGGSDKLMSYDNFNPARADIIISGAVLAEEIIDFLGDGKAKYTNFALRDGLLVDSQEAIEKYIY